jgi:hypothetical protein
VDSALRAGAPSAGALRHQTPMLSRASAELSAEFTELAFGPAPAAERADAEHHPSQVLDAVEAIRTAAVADLTSELGGRVGELERARRQPSSRLRSLLRSATGCGRVLRRFRATGHRP